MGFFDKIFGKKQTGISQDNRPDKKEHVNPDEQFVQEFIAKGGKFLYCTTQEEVLGYISQIFDENAWKSTRCFDENLNGLLQAAKINKSEKSPVFFTACEHLIAEDGSILFSSNQLRETKLAQYPPNFVVYATTSQLIHDKDKALMSIKHRFKTKIPTNISAVKDYTPLKKEADFMHYGNRNSKNLYLLLLEDL